MHVKTSWEKNFCICLLLKHISKMQKATNVTVNDNIILDTKYELNLLEF